MATAATKTGRQKPAGETGAWGDEVLRLEPRAVARHVSATRPHPDLTLVGADVPERFLPDPGFAEWIRATFITPDGALANADHAHLADAHLGVLWTNVIHQRQMRSVLATAEIPQVMGGAWKRGRAEQQLREWFGALPDFVLTFYAPGVAELEDRAFCALIEHELFHCAQAEDADGEPRFTRDGDPVFAIRAHDSEEFVGVVRRYGVTSRELREMVAAAQAAPLIGDGPIAIACGTCGRAAA